jgi:large subunit ribosomal protein L22
MAKAVKTGIEARAIQRTTRQSPYKMRLVIDQIRGHRVNDALALLRWQKAHRSRSKDVVERGGKHSASGPCINTSVDEDALW